MYTEIIINVGLSETRIAVLEDRRLVELWVERSAAERIVGDVHKGRVESIIPGLQAAFVNIGTEKSAFLHVSDFVEGAFDLDDLLGGKGEEIEEEKARPVQGSIEDYLKVGQDLGPGVQRADRDEGPPGNLEDLTCRADVGVDSER